MRTLFLLICSTLSLLAWDCSWVVKQPTTLISDQSFCLRATALMSADMTDRDRRTTNGPGFSVLDSTSRATASTQLFKDADQCYTTCIQKLKDK